MQQKRFATISIPIVFSALFAMVPFGLGQGYPEWAYYKNITINTSTAGVPGTVSNFPVLVRLTATNAADVFSGALSVGADVRFAKPDGTRLSYQLDRWEPTPRLADFWVLVDNLPGNTTTTIRMYWGRAGQTSQSNGAAVFATANNFQGVWHMGGSGTANVIDNTSNANTATNTGTVSQPALIGYGRLFDATSAQYLTVANHASLNPPQQITISAWVNPTSWEDGAVGANRRILQKGGDASQYGLREKNDADSLQWDVGGGAPNKPALPNSVMTLNAWNHVVVTYDAAQRRVYINGTWRLYQNTVHAIPVTTSALTLGGKPNSVVASDCFYGIMDEVRIGNNARSADWIKLEYETQKPNANAVGVGATLNVAPSSLSYANNPANYTVGTAISNNNPTVFGVVTGYSVNPALPAGLSLNAITGVISGTPTGVVATTSYSIIASNSGGSTTASLSITVASGVAPPANLTYSTNPAVYGMGAAIAPNTPSNTGGNPTGYSVSPALPAGLSLNTTTGAITGTPTAASSAANYTITATNSAGSTTATLSLAVGAPPSNLSYANPNATYTERVAIAANRPTVTGSVALYTVDPPLPAGLKLDSTTGIISGTPASASAAADYTVTASNSAGSATTVIRMAVQMAAPANLTYPTNPASYPTGSDIAPNIPSVSGSVSNYTVSPPLPAGLILDAASGMLWGHPTTAALAANYTVTASNSAGSTTTVLNLAITSSVAIAAKNSPPMLFLQVPGSSPLQFPGTFNKATGARLDIVDIWGRTLWSRSLTLGGAENELIWNGTTDPGRRAARGVYFARLRAWDAKQNTVGWVEKKIVYAR